MTVALVVQALASGMMCGIIWFVQMVHYPLFGRVPADDAAAHAAENIRRTRPVVLVPMVLEALAAGAIALAPPPGVGRAAAVAGLVMLAAVWGSTLLVQVPLHARLAGGEADPTTVDRLVRSNRFRTLVWTLRALLAGWMLLASR